jgi:hypothetical protein
MQQMLASSLTWRKLTQKRSVATVWECEKNAIKQHLRDSRFSSIWTENSANVV